MSDVHGVTQKEGGLRLVLFFTRNASLRSWEQVGILEREVLLYRRLQLHGVHVSFVTYGNADDLAYAERLPGISILCNRWSLRVDRYARWLHWLHWHNLCRADVYKTNQMNGAEAALASAKHWRKPLIARCGYMWSEFVAAEQGADSAAARYADAVERRVFGNARRIGVTTPAMAQSIAQTLPAALARVRIIPNYVDADHFAPATTSQPDVDLIFVGRLHSQKNVAALLEAIAPLSVSLRIIGDGPEGDQLQARFGNLGGRVEWLTHVANCDLPAYLHRARIFVLPSHYEGHPKTLLEAMSCGLPVIGTDRPGIREIIVHGANGWLCDTTPAAIRSAITHVLGNPSLQSELGRQARRYVESHVGLNRIVSMELAMLYEATCNQETTEEDG